MLATLGTAIFIAFSRDPGGDRADPGDVGHGVRYELRVTRLEIRSVGETRAREAVEAAAEEVRTAVQDLYLGGFVDPERWEEGEFPDAFRVFEPAASDRARRDLNALTLGAASRELEWVEPEKGPFSIVFLLDERNRPVAAVAGIVFAATGHLRDGGTVRIENGADLFLRPGTDGWRVYSYTASTTIEPEREPAAAPRGTGG